MESRIAVYNNKDGFHYYRKIVPEVVAEVEDREVNFYFQTDWDGEQRYVGYDVKTGINISALADMIGRDTVEEAIKEIYRIYSIFGDSLQNELERRASKVRTLKASLPTFILLKLIKAI